jgi:hypothetical protein
VGSPLVCTELAPLKKGVHKKRVEKRHTRIPDETGVLPLFNQLFMNVFTSDFWKPFCVRSDPK